MLSNLGAMRVCKKMTICKSSHDPAYYTADVLDPAIRSTNWRGVSDVVSATWKKTHASDVRQRQQRAYEWQLAKERDDDREKVSGGRMRYTWCNERWTYPKRFKKPNVSTIIPINGHLQNTRRMPPRKHTVPRIFCLRAKK